MKLSEKLYIWDSEDFLERIDNSSELLVAILEIFLDETVAHKNALGKSINEFSLEDIHLHAHSIKGAAANISASKLKDIAHKIETSTKSNSAYTHTEQFSQNFIKLENSLNELIIELNSYLGDENKSNIQENILDKDDAKSELEQIKQNLKLGIYIDTMTFKVFRYFVDNRLKKQLVELENMINNFLLEESLKATNDIIFKLNLVIKGRLDEE